MRRLFFAIILLLMPLAGTAQTELPANPAIEDVIQRQMEAFASRDVNTAWTFASPTIQQLFQHPTYFGAMVERGYPMVWTPGEVNFPSLREEEGRPVQRVQIVDGNGRVHLLDYVMVEINGRWRIAGVTILRGQHLGV
ncbi:DUF4864 domain-containing protein [Nioella aestuarii]|uniref:DUF4864 domain-containing protein n=1 Tax=Nioella aestuarii TaxID=1662864 RepID=UPI003D7F9D45